MKLLKELLTLLPGAVVKGNEDTDIKHITADSREVREGSLFICLVGAHVNGHDYIEQAVANGATALLVQEDRVFPETVAVIRVQDTDIAKQKIVPFFYDYPAMHLRMIGVTGTNGKTTVTHIIRHFLKEKGYKTGVIGTVHTLIGEETYPVNNTTPDVVDLQHILARMVREEVRYCIMEVSSHALALGRVAGVEFDTVVFTNLTQDHLDFHETLEDYGAAKTLLFSGVTENCSKKQTKCAVINMDDPYGAHIKSHTSCPVLTYGMEGIRDILAGHVTLELKKSSFKMQYEGRCYNVDSPISGLFNVYNVMAAIGAGLAEGLTVDDCVEALKTFKSVPGRFESVEEGQDFAVIVDYAHSPDGLENILRAAKELVKNRIIVVFGCGGDRDATKRPIMGRIAATMGDVVVVTSDNPRTEDPEQILKHIEIGVVEGLQGKGADQSGYEVISDRREAIRHAIGLAETGDMVVIAGKGHENYQILKDKTIHFDDKEEASRALKER